MVVSGACCLIAGSLFTTIPILLSVWGGWLRPADKTLGRYRKGVALHGSDNSMRLIHNTVLKKPL